MSFLTASGICSLALAMPHPTKPTISGVTLRVSTIFCLGRVKRKSNLDPFQLRDQDRVEEPRPQAERDPLDCPSSSRREPYTR